MCMLLSLTPMSSSTEHGLLGQLLKIFLNVESLVFMTDNLEDLFLPLLVHKSSSTWHLAMPRLPPNLCIGDSL